MNNAPAQLTPFEQNSIARRMILENGVDMMIPIFSQTLTGTIPGQVINIAPRNVGLIKRFIVEISFNIAQTAAETLNRSPIGPANVLSAVSFTDLNNQVRIQTTGWHLHNVASARRQFAYGAAFTSDTPTGIGSNFPVIAAPAAVTTVQPVRMYYEIPISYGDTDLRGAIWANVVNSTMNLQLTVNPNLVVATGANQVLSVYRSTTAAVAVPTAFTVTVYQNFVDQVPMSGNSPILPGIDMNMAYYLNNTVVAPIVLNQDNGIPYSNFRMFMSTMCIYDNGGTLNPGTDITRWNMQAANSTSLFQYTPNVAQLLARNIIADDFQLGTYYFDHRKKPIQTTQYGNMQLNFVPSVVNANAAMLVGFESLGMQQLVAGAGSLFNT